MKECAGLHLGAFLPSSSRVFCVASDICHLCVCVCVSPYQIKGVDDEDKGPRGKRNESAERKKP